MWYIIIIIIMVFEAAISIVAPYFPNLTTTVIDTTANTTMESSDLIAAGFNPFETFIALHGFQIQGAEIFGVVFWICDILLILCALKLIRGS